MVKILTQNVRGLKNDVKRRGLFLCTKQKADVICLQEVHSDGSVMKSWENEFKGKIWWSHGMGDARGVCICVQKNVSITVLDSYADSDGRVVAINYKENEEKFTLINVYAPNDDNPKFFVDALKIFKKWDGKRILIGDFNVALNPKIDRSNKDSKNNNKSMEIINKYLEDSLMSDVWRERNPDRKTYTFCRSKPHFIGSRLDYAIVDSSITEWVNKIDIIPGYRTDHSAIVMNIIPFNVDRGRGYWKLNNQVLYELKYLNKINLTIKAHESTRKPVGFMQS